MNWNPEKIEQARKVLGQSLSVKRAAKKIGTTPSALRKAFKKYDLPSPKTFLKDIDEDCAYILDAINEIYVITNEDGDAYQRSYEEIEDIFMLYCNKPEGFGKTVTEIVNIINLDEEKENTTKQEIETIVRALGMTHKSFPVAPHQVGDGADSILNSQREKKEQLLRAHKYQKDHSQYVTSLEQEVASYRDTIGIVDNLFKKPSNLILDKTQDPKQMHPNNLFIWFTDAHAGKLVKSDSPLLGPRRRQIEYNSAIFKERIHKLCEYIGQVAGTFGNIVTNVQVMNLGDSCEALIANMRMQQGLEQYSFMEEQAQEVKWMNTSVIETILDAFPNCDVDFYKFGGNHDRLTKEKEGHTESLATYLFVDALKERYRGVDRLKVHAAPSFMSVLYPTGLNVIGQHGHFTNWDSRQQILSAVSIHGYPNAKRYILVQGHKHSFDIKSDGEIRRIILPAVVGADSFSADKIAKADPPGFVCMLSDGKDDIIIGPFDLR